MSHLKIDPPCLILAGGLGTRLRGVVAGPKVLAPVCGRPFLSFVLDQLVRAGLGRVALLTGYAAEQVEQTFGSRHQTLEIAYVREGRLLGTGGALRQALDRFDDPAFIVMNGDSYCPLDFAKLLAFHRRNKGDLTMAVTRVADVSRFGQVQFAALGRSRISGFVEKGAAAGPGWVNAGIYLVERPLIEEITPARPSSLEQTWLPDWIARHTLLAHPVRQSLLDIGTPESYQAAQEFFRRHVTETVDAMSA